MCRYSALDKNDQSNLQEILLENFDKIELDEIIVSQENQNSEQENLNNFKDQQRLEIERGERWPNGKKMSQKNQRLWKSHGDIPHSDSDEIYPNQVNIRSIGQVSYGGSTSPNKTTSRNL
jgi:hypothetical protein